ncbi:hypothetical protein [Vibrio gallaecicus]|nr:hypothetical protein [Vibrio gallaecicus]MDN3616939.1 hypothetical protein [Vibrio gallaecicus]
MLRSEGLLVLYQALIYAISRCILYGLSKSLTLRLSVVEINILTKY